MISSKKSLTEALSIIILLFSLVIIAVTAFAWINQLQDNSETGTDAFVEDFENKLVSNVQILDEVYSNKILSVFLSNGGRTTIPIVNKTSIIVYSENQIICARDYSQIQCISGCNENLNAGESRRIDILLNEDCDISEYFGKVRYKLDFGGIVGVTSVFEK